MNDTPSKEDATSPMANRTPPCAARTSLAGNEDHRNRWLLSYADLVTLLFALFVVLYAAADRGRARAIAESLAKQLNGTPASTLDGGQGVLPGAPSLDHARAAIDRTVAANSKLRAYARVSNTERGFVVSLAEAGFFAPGEAAVREEAGALLDELADTLRDEHTLLRIEGHTDSTPIFTARYPSNWELSSARAAAVLTRLAARGISSARLSLAGYAGERPVADNSTLEGRALNRRVDLVILQMKD